MEADIDLAMNCLQRQRIPGSAGNTGITPWRGKASLLSPREATGNVTIDVEYSLDNPRESREYFQQFAVGADQAPAGHWRIVRLLPVDFAT